MFIVKINEKDSQNFNIIILNTNLLNTNFFKKYYINSI